MLEEYLSGSVEDSYIFINYYKCILRKFDIEFTKFCTVTYNVA